MYLVYPKFGQFMLVAHLFLVTYLAHGAEATQSESNATVYADLAYSSSGTNVLLLDLYLPAKSHPMPLPTIVWIHGGSWEEGSRKNPVPALSFTEYGYAIAAVDYRFSQEARFPAQLEDCQAAVMWLREHAETYGLNPDRIGAWGASAGGHLAALLGTVEGDDGEGSARVSAVCDWYGPTDFTLDAQATRSRSSTSMTRLIGGSLEQNRDRVRMANPSTHASSDDPPFLIVHGDRDERVRIAHSRQLHNALLNAGVSSMLYILPGAGHGTREFASNSTLQLVRRFFDRNLKRLSD